MTGYVLIPVHNCLHLTMKCVEGVLAQDVPVELLIVNNGSMDGSTQWLATLQSEHSNVSVIAAYPEKGVSWAWNRGLTYLFDKLKVPHVLVLNNDTEIRPDTYRRLAEDGGQFVTCVGTSSGANFPGGEPDPSAKRPHPDFSCFLLRKECWDKIGKLDERMSIYCGDGDYHLRMHQAGIEAYCIDLPFYHYASGTLKACPTAERDAILQQGQRDRKAFYDKWQCDMGTKDYYEMFASVPSSTPA